MLTLNIKISDEQVQNIPKGPLMKPSKPQGSKKLFTHPPMQSTHTIKTVSKGPETSQLSSVLATIPQELGEVAEFVHQGTIYSV